MLSFTSSPLYPFSFLSPGSASAKHRHSDLLLAALEINVIFLEYEFIFYNNANAFFVSASSCLLIIPA